MISPVLDSLIIRAATPYDFEAISAIYEHHVLLGTGSFEIKPPSSEEMLKRYEQVQAFGGVYLVAEFDEAVLGYAYATAYNQRAAYFNTVTDSIYVHPQAQGSGIGKALLMQLIKECENKGFRQMIAIIGDSDNLASQNLHKACGFTEIGVLPAVGYKFGRWLDSVLMQRALGKGSKSSPTRKEQK